MNKHVKVTTDSQTKELLNTIKNGIEDAIREASNNEEIVDVLEDVLKKQKKQSSQVEELRDNFNGRLNVIKDKIEQNKISDIISSIDNLNLNTDSSAKLFYQSRDYFNNVEILHKNIFDNSSKLLNEISDLNLSDLGDLIHETDNSISEKINTVDDNTLELKKQIAEVVSRTYSIIEIKELVKKSFDNMERGFSIMRSQTSEETNIIHSKIEEKTSEVSEYLFNKIIEINENNISDTKSQIVNSTEITAKKIDKEASEISKYLSEQMMPLVNNGFLEVINKTQKYSKDLEEITEITSNELTSALISNTSDIHAKIGSDSEKTLKHINEKLVSVFDKVILILNNNYSELNKQTVKSTEELITKINDKESNIKTFLSDNILSIIQRDFKELQDNTLSHSEKTDKIINDFSNQFLLEFENLKISVSENKSELSQISQLLKKVTENQEIILTRTGDIEAVLNKPWYKKFN